MSPKPSNLVEVYRSVFKSPHGKLVLQDLQSRFHEHLAPDLTLGNLAYAEGQRSVWFYINRVLTGQVYQPQEEPHDDTDS